MVDVVGGADVGGLDVVGGGLVACEIIDGFGSDFPVDIP